MSDTGDCACSQEIENSSCSTANSKKRSALTELILKNGQKSLDRESMCVVTRDRFPRLPLMKKRDYIENWILSNVENFSKNFPKQTSIGASRLGIGRKKRVPGSPILGNGWKRARVGDVGTKENSSSRYDNDSAECRNNQYSVERQREMFQLERDNSELTMIAANSRVKNFRTFSSIIAASTVSRGLSCTMTRKTSLEAGIEASRLKARVQESAEMSKLLSTSLPLVGAKSAKSFDAIVPREDCERKGDRVVCKFSWHGKISGTRRSVNSSRKSVESLSEEFTNLPEVNSSHVRDENTAIEACPAMSREQDSDVRVGEITMFTDICKESCGEFQGESPLRWNGYKNLTREPAKRDKTRLADRGVILSKNSSPADKQIFTNIEAESPLRWKGYEIRESVVLPETMSLSSPIIDRQCSIQSSYTENPKENTLFDDRDSIKSGNSSPKVRKSPQKIEAESPLRWNGYHSEICDISNLSYTPGLDSPIIEPERIIQSSSTKNNRDDNLILDDQSSTCNLSQEEKRENLKIIDAESPLRWNGYGFSESRKLSRLSLSSPLMDSELFVIRSSSSVDTRYYSKNDDKREFRVKDSRLRGKKLSIKLETIFNSKNCDGEISQSSISTNNRESSVPLIDNEEIDVESLTALDPVDDTKIDDETQSLSDNTVSDVIENVRTPSRLRKNSIIPGNKGKDVPREDTIERGSKTNEEDDSDETYCSDVDPVCHSPRDVILSRKKSQRISELTINDRALSRNKSDVISQTSSPLKNNAETTIQVITNNSTRNIGKRTKKAKKGSLVAKLQSLVNLQASNLQIWQYQTSRTDFKNLRAQYVRLTIIERETRYGRHFLTATIVEDSHKLLNDLFANDDKSSNEKQRIVTLMIVPEINGTTKIRDDSDVNIYPPWDIMDRGEKLLNIIYFDVMARKEESNVVTWPLIENERVLEKFECPCIRSGAIDVTCPVKFTNTKPSVMQAMFG